MTVLGWGAWKELPAPAWGLPGTREKIAPQSPARFGDGALPFLGAAVVGGGVLRAPEEMGVFPFEEEKACPGPIAEARVSSRVRRSGPSGRDLRGQGQLAVGSGNLTLLLCGLRAGLGRTSPLLPCSGVWHGLPRSLCQPPPLPHTFQKPVVPSGHLGHPPSLPPPGAPSVSGWRWARCRFGKTQRPGEPKAGGGRRTAGPAGPAPGLPTALSPKEGAGFGSRRGCADK